MPQRHRPGAARPLGAPAAELEPGWRLTPLLLRLVAILFLAAGLARACLVLGITSSGESFATLTPAWRAGAVTLMCLNLFTGVGLWIGATWGPVMWAVAALAETAMYTIFAEHFGSHPLRVGLHVLLLSLYLAIAFSEWRRGRAGSLR
ncbi:MAG TPA: DUF6163 family protein [Afifellaceae bacterium]|nr:DUF6163 family protein [Afifellaceae bacterium]